MCKFLSLELTDELEKSGSSKAVVESGSRLNVKGDWAEQKKMAYKTSYVQRILKILIIIFAIIYHNICLTIKEYFLQYNQIFNFKIGSMKLIL